MSRIMTSDAISNDNSLNMDRDKISGRRARPVILDDLCEHPAEHVSADGTRCLACGQLYTNGQSL